MLTTIRLPCACFSGFSSAAALANAINNSAATVMAFDSLLVCRIAFSLSPGGNAHRWPPCK
jgi:hypothetical protein